MWDILWAHKWGAVGGLLALYLAFGFWWGEVLSRREAKRRREEGERKAAENAAKWAAPLSPDAQRFFDALPKYTPPTKG
ncbi:MAG: hypothetical protein WAX89_01055 [Alphaproteobacteria bacterium]